VPSPIYQQQLMNTINELKSTGQTVDEASFASDEERMAAQLQAAHDFVSAAFMKPKEVASVVQNVQQETVSIETFDCDVVKPMTAEQYQMVAQRIHDEISEDQSIGDKEIKAIDLVGMIFEYMLSDEQLPDSVKAVLSYLHTPFLKIAIVDPDFFEQPDHPARALLNILAEAGHKWVNSDGASQFKIFPKIKAVVRQILLDSECSLDMLRELVQEMTEFNSKVSRKIEMLEQRAKAKAEGEEKIRLVKRRVYSEIKHRMDDKAVPAAVVVLLLHPWADYMIFTLLRHGEESEAWNNALTMVDNILWSIESKDDEADVVRQQRLLNRLQVEIKHAIDEISFDSNKANKLIKILHDLQLKAINHQEIISANAEEQKKIEDAVHLDEYVIAEEEKASNEEKAMLDKLQHVEFGSWLESGDHKNRMKIAWYNPKTEHYMLVDGSGQNVSMRSALSIVRDLLNDDVKIVETSKRPFIERALENIVRKLKAPLSAQVA
jgi:hypothetical protein